MEKIKTYLIVSDTTHYLDPPIGTQSSFYEIENFIHPGLSKYSTSTLTLENNEVSIHFCNSVDVDQVSNLFILEGSTRKIITIVKFWGNVSQDYTFTGLSLAKHYHSTLDFRFNEQSASEKDEDKNKYFTKMILPYLRDEKLNTILGDI